MSQNESDRPAEQGPLDGQRGQGDQGNRKRRRRGGRRRRGKGGGQGHGAQGSQGSRGQSVGDEIVELPPVDEASLVLPPAFAELGIAEPVLKAIAAMGWEEPSPVQQEMIPVALTGRDVLGQARTGTGKTAAFGVPVLQNATPGAGTQAIILTPTRELAVQVSGELIQLSRFTSIRVEAVYGGTRVRSQMQRLTSNPEIVVGTPGRVMDMMGRGVLGLGRVRWAVLDEVDRMLDIGFREDIRRILRQVPADTQKLFVSATLPDDVNRLINEYSPDLTRLTLSEDRMTVEQVKQYYVSVERWDKYRLLLELIRTHKPELAIVFTNTKRQTDRVAEKLERDGINARQIHGDLMQRQRAKVMRSFREQKIHVLVATDLMGRGIDVGGISHIINYDIPANPEVYVHRIGRTARMGAIGVAISFITGQEGKELTEVEKLINLQVEPLVVEGFDSTPPPPEEAARREIDAGQHEGAEVVSRLDSPVSNDQGMLDKLGPPPKTLGSHFKTPLRRKLKRLKRR
ncbi:MAG: DEAD-box ATP-dependent RNA helicase CshA [Phycisphaerae bacterium]|nr:DEAD-box ATP-dependent RNA helicase CshA [Phycisphaerae bacterium]